jgi:hypothetical protein
MGLAVMSLTPVEDAVILYHSYYRLTVLLSKILPAGLEKIESATKPEIARDIGTLCPDDLFSDAIGPDSQRW